MATENQQNTLEGNPSELPADHELFAGKVHEELSEREVFAGDEDLYKLLQDTATATKNPPAPAETDTAKPPIIPLIPFRRKHLSTLQKALILSIVAVTVMLIYSLIKPPPSASPRHSRKTVRYARIPPAPLKTSSSGKPHHLEQIETQKYEPPLQSNQALSLKVAEDFYLQNDYENAHWAYNRLLQNLPDIPQDPLLRDFLQLRIALSLLKTAQSLPQPDGETTRDQASRMLVTASNSPSPIVRLIANYHRSLLQMQRKQFLNAQTSLHQTIALISAVDLDKDWALSLKQDCHFLVAQCLTRSVLSLADADKDLPNDLWPNTMSSPEPFTGLTEAQLCSLLNSGSDQFNKALLGPKIRKLNQQDPLPHWSATCHGASIEEMLSRFAANADLDLSWASERTRPFSQAQNPARKRPVTLYLPTATTQQLITVAAGCAGLLARIDDNNTINIFNPDDYDALSEHISLLTHQAISLWQRFLLTFHDDRRIPNAHFALALLQAQNGRPADAIAQYKLVANRFSHTSLAPFAFLHSSRLKAGLHNHPGARQDLTNLVEQYPDTEIAGTACLQLAHATAKTGLVNEAARLYRKVYHLAPSSESQRTAALEAARCHFQQQDYHDAAKWLTRYITMAKEQKSEQLYQAYLLLGKTALALGKTQDACDAFRYALQGHLSPADYLETTLALIKACIQQERFVEALAILETTHTTQLAKKDSVQILLIKSRLFTAMGMVEKAVAALADFEQYLADQNLKAQISLELANCYITNNDLELASKKLIETILVVDPGPLAHQAQCQLAEVCLKLGQNQQAVSICSRLLNSHPDQLIRQKTLKLLAAAYTRENNYDQAALALLGRPNQAEITAQQTPPDTLGATDTSPHQVQ